MTTNKQKQQNCPTKINTVGHFSVSASVPLSHPQDLEDAGAHHDEQEECEQPRSHRIPRAFVIHLTPRHLLACIRTHARGRTTKDVDRNRLVYTVYCCSTLVEGSEKAKAHTNETATACAVVVLAETHKIIPKLSTKASNVPTLFVLCSIISNSNNDGSSTVLLCTIVY